MPYIGNQPGTGVRSRFIYTATASQTTFSGADNNSKTLKYSDADYIDVYLNGVCLVPGTDYTASTKTSVVLTQAASLSDTLEVVAYDIATISDTVSKADGGTFDGNITITTNDNSNPLTLKSTDDDASIGPVLEFNRSSSSPADNDQIGRIDMVGKNDADQDVDYVVYVNQIRDTTDGTEDGRMAINTAVNGTMSSRMNVEPTETVFNDESNDIDFRVESDGNANMLFVEAANNYVGVGTNADFGGRLNVKNTVQGEHAVRFENTVASYNTYNIWSTFTGGSNINTTAIHYAGYSDNGNKFIVYGNGNVQNTNNSYGALSDEKLKENIVDSGSQWDDIKAVRVRKYSMKEDELNAPNKIGVIAQELEASGMNGLVFESPDRDENGNLLETSTKQVHYSVLYMKAIKALQEAIAKIETLETKVAALEAG